MEGLRMETGRNIITLRRASRLELHLTRFSHASAQASPVGTAAARSVTKNAVISCAQSNQGAQICHHVMVCREDGHSDVGQAVRVHQTSLSRSQHSTTEGVLNVEHVQQADARPFDTGGRGRQPPEVSHRCAKAGAGGARQPGRSILI